MMITIIFDDDNCRCQGKPSVPPDGKLDGKAMQNFMYICILACMYM